MEEVYEKELYVELLENNIPLLSNVSSEEDDLIASFDLKDDEPIKKESTAIWATTAQT